MLIKQTIQDHFNIITGWRIRDVMMRINTENSFVMTWTEEHRLFI